MNLVANHLSIACYGFSILQQAYSSLVNTFTRSLMAQPRTCIVFLVVLIFTTMLAPQLDPESLFLLITPKLKLCWATSSSLPLIRPTCSSQSHASSRPALPFDCNIYDHQSSKMISCRHCNEWKHPLRPGLCYRIRKIKKTG
jgi:hypothetical protein